MPRKVAMVAGGISRFDMPRFETQEEMMAEAMREALDDTPNLEMSDIDTVVACYFADHFEQQLAFGWIIHDYLGQTPKPNIRVENGGATGGSAIATAYSMVASGYSDVCLVCGWEKMGEVGTPKANEFIALASDTDFDFPVGGYYTGYYAAMAARHMYLYGETEEDFAKIAVKNRNNTLDNPYSQWNSAYGKKITVDDVLESRLIAWPLKILDCCLISDGAALNIFATEEVAKKLTDDPLWLIGVGLGTDMMRPGDRPDNPGMHNRFPGAGDNYPDYAVKPREPYPEIANFGACRAAAQQAYKMAGITDPYHQIDCAEIHDAYDTSELQTYEDLMFVPTGRGRDMIEQSYVDGDMPVNMSGGLEGMGHPVGATAIAQGTELFWQMRGEIPKKHTKGGKTQVKDPMVGILHSHAGTGTALSVNVYCREKELPWEKRRGKR
jgi:acetyl-CoA C-acetyltransferase